MASEKHPQQQQQQQQQPSFAQAAANDYSAELQRYLIRRLGDAQNARDLAQEVYLRLLRVGNADHIWNRRAYLYRIASHVVYEFRMRARQALVVFDSEAVDEWAERATDASADNLSERLDTQRQLERLLAELPPLCRAVFLLQKQEGLTYEEIAEKLGISVHAVQRYLFRALAALRAGKW